MGIEVRRLNGETGTPFHGGTPSRVLDTISYYTAPSLLLGT